MDDPNRLRVGCCGFPVGLARYAQAFRVGEVQQTFYQPPLPSTLERWRSQVPEEFEFTLKAWQLITHEVSSPTYRRLREKLTEKQRREVGRFRVNQTVMRAWVRTLECARFLRSRVVLFQCPARFTPSAENQANLRAFFREVRRDEASRREIEGLTFVWEPRGEWAADEVRELCDELGLVHGVDPFRQQPVTKGMTYFRLHGLPAQAGKTGYRYRYTKADLEELLRLTRPHTPGYVLFNNIRMLQDARSFIRLASVVAHSGGSGL